MYFIETKKLVHEYFRRDRDGNIEGIQVALDNINLKVRPGSFISIVGHNGSGKSTLAKHLNALLHPSDGVVLIDGMDTLEADNELSVRKSVGMVFQNPDNQLVSNIVEEDVAFGPENLGVPSEKIEDRVENALKNLEMWEYKDTSVSHLSGGQKQRVAIAGILAMEPKAIVFDEATSMLDPKGRQDLVNLAHKINKEKSITIIFITHYMEEIIGSDYIYVLENGNIILEGIDKEIFSQAEFLREHKLDVPQIVQIADRLREHGLNIPEGIISIDELVQALKGL